MLILIAYNIILVYNSHSYIDKYLRENTQTANKLCKPCCQKEVLMMNGKSAVEKGIAFENKMLGLLKECGIEAWRTNTANPDDPEQYKAGFDGGIDIIGRYSVKGKIYKDFVFYIQCKCRKNDLTKTAICEAYAGMHARNGNSAGSIPVVIAHSDATEETIQFAKSLGVELILDKDILLLTHTQSTGQVKYGNYGILMKILLSHYAKDVSFLEGLPDTVQKIDNIDIKQNILDQTKIDIDFMQSEWDAIAIQESKLQQKRQRALDKTKVAMIRNIQTCDFHRNGHEIHIKSDTPTISLDSG